MKITLIRNVPNSKIRFVVPCEGRGINLKQGAELTVVQDLGQKATKILIQTSDDQRDNAWIPIEYVRFGEL